MKSDFEMSDKQCRSSKKNEIWEGLWVQFFKKFEDEFHSVLTQLRRQDFCMGGHLWGSASHVVQGRIP